MSSAKAGALCAVCRAVLRREEKTQRHEWCSKTCGGNARKCNRVSADRRRWRVKQTSGKPHAVYVSAHKTQSITINVPREAHA